MPLIWAALGWIVGTALNAVTHELPRSDRLLARPRCPHCHGLLGLSSLTLLPGGRRRRCASCGAVVMPTSHSLEWATAAVFGLLYWRFDFSPALLVYSLYAVLLLVVLAIDLHHRWVYSVICYPAILAALVLTPVVTDNILDGVLGAVLGAGIFLGLYWLGRLVYRGREPMGSGDITIAAMIGAMVGPQQVLIALFLGALVVASVSIVLLATRRARGGDLIPYGAGLCIGALLVLLRGGGTWPS
jgi:prepilin signal peptidase PulO-like enzyme (type II secretory pathway)